jgi:hypothetical protein
MIEVADADFLVGALCFGLSTIFGIRLRDDLTVPTAAALAPTAAALTVSASSTHWSLLLVAPAAAGLALILMRAPFLEVFSHVGLFLASVGILTTGVSANGRLTASLLLALGLTLAYSVVEVGRQKLSFRGHAHITADLRMWWLLQAVLVCASGLTVLVVERLGWPAFAAMAAVLALTKREFEGFALSRVALDQTVRALARLSENAQRVASGQAMVTKD